MSDSERESKSATKFKSLLALGSYLADNFDEAGWADCEERLNKVDAEMQAQAAIIAKYEAAIDEHKRSKLYAFDPDFKLWQTREK